MAAPFLQMYMTFQILLLFPVPRTNITIVACQIKVQNQLKAPLTCTSF